MVRVTFSSDSSDKHGMDAVLKLLIERGAEVNHHGLV
jgi:hypothetical protein